MDFLRRFNGSSRAFSAFQVQKPVKERTALPKEYDFVLETGDNEASATGIERPMEN
jgi:hypothetical protein